MASWNWPSSKTAFGSIAAVDERDRASAGSSAEGPTQAPKVPLARDLRNWLTVERMLYGACLMTAAALRFRDLGADPLQRSEAATVWPAWVTAMTGAGPALPSSELPTSALLFSLDWLVFWLAGGGNDAMARWAPAIVGTGLVLLPWALRPIIGHTSALMAAGILAIDPMLVSLSRRAEGAMLSAFCGFLVFVAFARLGEVRRGVPSAAPRPLVFGAFPAIALGLLLVSGPEGWSFLVLGAVVVVSTWTRGRPTNPGPIWGALASGGDSAARLIGIALVTAFVAATAGLAQWESLGAVSTSLTAWMRNWGNHRPASATADLIVGLAGSQPLLLVLPIAGLLSGWASRDQVTLRHMHLMTIPVLAAILLAVGQARAWAGPVPLVLALALAAAHACGELVRRFPLQQGGSPRRAVLGWIVWLAIGLLVLVTIRSAVVGYQTWRPGVALPGVSLLARDVAILCAWRAEASRACRIDIVARPWPDPLLAWNLRDFTGLRWVLSPSLDLDAAGPPLIIAPAGSGGGERTAPLALPSRYVGSAYRTDGALPYDQIVLWVPRE